MMNRKFSHKKLAALIFTLLSSELSFAIDFNSDILDSVDKKNIDLTRFSKKGYILPGSYQMKVKLNGDVIDSDVTIPFYLREEGAPEDSDIPKPCISENFSSKLGLNSDAKANVFTWGGGQCADFSALGGVTIEPNISTRTLNINIPYAWLEYSDSSWIPSSRWDNGITGMLIDYNAIGSVINKKGNSQSQNATVSGTVGGNFSAWRLRGDYQSNYKNITNSNLKSKQKLEFDFTRIYLYRPIPHIKSVLTMGQNFISSNIFDSWRYNGVSLSSDERMLPSRLRGYAPEIIGVAKSNARVTVMQQGRILYDSTMPAGPFKIQDLDSSVRGQLDVNVTEQNGEVQKFSVSTSSVPYLTRPGQVRYQVATGRPSSWGNKIEGPIFANTEASWGISNSWSLYGGGTLSDDFQALALGVGRDLYSLGTAAIDVTQSLARLSENGVLSGKSWRLSYSKRFDEANTDLTFAGYRFSDKNYRTMQGFLDMKVRGNNPSLQKERYQINLRKSFDEVNVPFSISSNYERQIYWDQDKTNQYSASMGTWFDVPYLGLNNVMLTATAMRSQYSGVEDDSINLMLTVNLSNGTLSYNSDLSKDQVSQRLGYYAKLNDLDSYSVSASASADRKSDKTQTQFNGMYTHHSDIMTINANAALAESRYTSIGMNANGGVTLTGKGVAMHPGGYNGSTRLMLDTSGIGGVPIDNGRIVTNRWGIGVLSNVNSYYRTTSRVDINKLVDNVDATQGVVEIALTDGAIGYRSFEMLKGERLYAIIRLSDGSYPPFGASVLDEKGRELGIVGEDGLAWLTGLIPDTDLDVAWGGGKNCHIKLPSKLSVSKLLMPCNIY